VRNNEVKQGENYPSAGYDVLDLSDLPEEENKIDVLKSSIMTVNKETATIYKVD
jgi:hypothetical protein